MFVKNIINYFDYFFLFYIFKLFYIKVVMDPKFYKYLYIIGFLALIVAILTIYQGLNEINLFFNERIKI